MNNLLRWWHKRDRTPDIVDAAMLTMVAVLILVVIRG